MRKPFDPLELLALLERKLGMTPLQQALEPEGLGNAGQMADLRRLPPGTSSAPPVSDQVPARAEPSA